VVSRTAIFVATLAAVLWLPPAAHAQTADAKEVSRYVLTEAGLGKFTRATQNLAAVPGACVREDSDDGSSNASLDQLVAKLEATPGAKAAIQSAGMTSREYIVFMFSMMEAGLSAWAVKQPGGKLPPGVQQANVDFFNAHETAMAQIGKEDPCGGDDEEDDGDEG